METTIGRLRQIVSAIRQRLVLRRREQDLRLEWQTKALAGMFAATALTDEKGHRTLMQAVESMTLVPRERSDDDSTPLVDIPTDPSQWTEEQLEAVMQGKIAHPEPRQGSYEQLTGGVRSG